MSTGGLAKETHKPLIRPGIYGNVEETVDDDLAGVEIELIVRGSNKVETVLCEGWCNSSNTSSFEERDGTLYYDLREELTDQDGTISVNLIAVELRPWGRNVRARMPGFMEWVVLKRLPRPFGLRVARQNAGRKNDR